MCNGATGAQGIQGLTGAQGIQGVAGTNGANGAQGIQGVAGTNGTDGKNTLAKTTTEAAGANCTTGGVKIEYGLDANNNGTLDVSEINASLTKYVCNGAVGATGATGAQGPAGATGTQGIQGLTGPTGANGTNGITALVKTTAEAAGVNCTYGGTKVETGLDVNNNGILEAGEINGTQTTYVCNGAGAGGGSVQFSNMQVYSTPGTYSWTCPVGVTKVLLELWGGGQGGGISGGQGGGYGKAIINVNPGTLYTITVGSGGLINSIGGNSSAFGIISYGGGASGSSTATISIIGQGGGGNPCQNQNNHGEGGDSGNGGFGAKGTCGNGGFPGGGGGASCQCPNSPYSVGGGGRVIIYY